MVWRLPAPPKTTSPKNKTTLTKAAAQSSLVLPRRIQEKYSKIKNFKQWAGFFPYASAAVVLLSGGPGSGKTDDEAGTFELLEGDLTVDRG
jgi:hypothetical protein